MRWLLVVTTAIAWALASALAVDYATRNAFLLWVEHWTGDWRTAYFADRNASQHPDIAIVAINEETLQAFPYRSPVDRAYLAKLVETLDRMGAKTIGLDFLMIRPTEPAKDAQLVRAIEIIDTPVVVAVGDVRAELTPDELAYQRGFVETSGARQGFANLLTGSDRVVRYIAPPVAGDPVQTGFAQELATPGAEPLSEPRRIAWLLKPEDNSDTFLTLPAHLLMPPGLSGPSPLEATFTPLIKDKIVLVGAMLPDLDRHVTPLPDWEGEVKAGVVLQAQVVAQILDGRDILRLRKDALMALFAGLALLGVLFGIRHGAVAYTLYGGIALMCVAAIDIGLFVVARQIIPFGACVLALGLGLFGGVLLRWLLRMS